MAGVAFLEERLHGGLSVFEYGSGNSTLFLASRVERVVSVEQDPSWHAYVADLMPENVELILCQPYFREAYLDVIRQQAQKFDIMIVDAHEREDCSLDSINWLTPGGFSLYRTAVFYRAENVMGL